MNKSEPHRETAAVVLLNPAAGGGTARSKWARISETVRQRFGEVRVIVFDRVTDLPAVVGSHVASGYTRLVSAGGDGTVNAVVDALMTAADSSYRLQLGAIGLGSSNDFHKPFRKEQQIHGISCKIDFDAAANRDVGVLEFEDAQGRWRKRYWMINAGLGITAAANDFFNSPDALLRRLKRRSTTAAILYAALRTITGFHSENCWVQTAIVPSFRTRVTNLGIVKSPHFSGSFCYDSRFEPTSGRFHVHLCEDMSLPSTLFTLWQLSKHRFTDLPHTKSWDSDRLIVTARIPFPVEFDGEVIHTRKAAFSVAERQLEVCQ